MRFSRFFELRGLLIGCGIVALICAYYGISAIFFPDPARALERSLAYIEACTDEALEENATVCARPAVTDMLERISGAQLMHALARRVSAQQCHYIGHVVGQQSYEKYGNVEQAMDQCDRTCDSACTHGIIGEAFARELGAADTYSALDLQHMNADDIRRVGTKLCGTPDTCHGVGHALFQTFGAFDPGLAMCREVADGISTQFCYRGLFMEYADVLSARNMRETDGVRYPAPDELDAVCGQPTLDERRACFRYYPRIVVTTLEQSGYERADAEARLRELCAAHPDPDDRTACVAGIGVYSSYAVARDPAAAIGKCAAFASRLDQAACNLGQVSVATRDRQSRVMAYCAALGDPALRTHCFQSVFFFLDEVGALSDEAIARCKDDICRAAAGWPASDPWAGLRAFDE